MFLFCLRMIRYLWWEGEDGGFEEREGGLLCGLEVFFFGRFVGVDMEGGVQMER